jgi:hypothetical protein
MPDGSGSTRQGFPDEGRRQFSLNPYALPTVIVRIPPAGFPAFFAAHSCQSMLRIEREFRAAREELHARA